MSGYSISQRPDGKWAFDLKQPIKKPLHIPKTLTPSIIPRINEEMVRRSAGAVGKFEAWAFKSFFALALPKDLTDEVIGLDEEIYLGTLDSWKNPMTILADESFTQMMLAASLTAPETEFFPEELLAPSGTVFFEKAITLEPLFSHFKDDPSIDPSYVKIMTELPIRGFHWGEMSFDGIGFFFLADGSVTKSFEEDSEKGTKGNPFYPKELYHSLSTVSFSAIPWDMDTDLHATVRKSVAVLRSLKAIAESPISLSRKTREVGQLGSSKRRKSRTKPKATEIQLLSLRRPEEASRELKAATGIKQRAHWVRGHWRNQWYPKQEKHEAVWIEGFAKGDPSLGVVSKERVYLAKGD